MKEALLSVFESIRADPNLLLTSSEAITVKKAELQKFATAGAQGTGNQVTPQEAAFACLLEAAGFPFAPKGSAPPEGLFYRYQANGTQQAIDFQVSDGTSTIDMDLKHTLSDVFFLNDGWFHSEVIYIVSWQRKTSEPRKKIVREPAVLIAYGETIPTTEEDELMKELQAIRTKLNTEKKGVGSLHTYVRFANRYSCERFTKEHTEELFEAVKVGLE